MVSSPDETSFNILVTPTSLGRKRISAGSIPPRTVWKPQPHSLVAVSWSLRAVKVAPLANVEGLARIDTPPQVVQTPTRLVGCCLMEL